MKNGCHAGRPIAAVDVNITVDMNIVVDVIFAVDRLLGESKRRWYLGNFGMFAGNEWSASQKLGKVATSVDSLF